MKIKLKYLLLALPPTLLAACSTPNPVRGDNQPVQYLGIYHVTPGAEEEFALLLEQVWQGFQKDGRILPKPHFRVRVNETTNRIEFVELLTFKNEAASRYPPASLTNNLHQIMRLCEPRRSQLGLEVRRAQVLIPKTQDPAK